MKIRAKKIEAYEISFGGKPVVFTRQEAWQGMVLLVDGFGRKIIASEPEPGLFANVLGDVLGALGAQGIDTSHTMSVVRMPPELISLIDETSCADGDGEAEAKAQG